MAAGDVEKAENLREEGNGKFRAGDLASARKAYEDVLKLLEGNAAKGLSDDSESDLLKRVRACRQPTQLNLALCCLRQEQFDPGRALMLCEEVLTEEPENPKATYRKGKALLALEEFEEAEYELLRACKLAPGDVAPRKDLEALRKNRREQKAKQQETFHGLFDRKPGFASEGRRDQVVASSRQVGGSGKAYDFQQGEEQNPFISSKEPEAEAAMLQAEGRFEEAVLAWEATLCQSLSKKDWQLHFTAWLELGRLFMDMNVDALALRCFNRLTGNEDEGESGRTSGPPPSQALKQNALLLRAVCLLNEAETDPGAEVSAGLEDWLKEAAPESESSSAALPSRLESLRSKRPGADVSIAQALLSLVSGSRAAALRAFVEALECKTEEGSCFGDMPQLATRWNMLGAVLANAGEQKKSLAAYSEALRLQPHYPRALVNCAIALESTGSGREAVRSCMLAAQCLPEWAARDSIWPLAQKAASGADESIQEAVAQRSVQKALHLCGDRPSEGAAGNAAELLASLSKS
eukprot:TRINITY_DN96862_c0_g1_i1.p1 TRINITY_DN96862_c0_g1~~TRINITY_DN96862_c0_g1_i1.p1  ORF type:complete len:535 (-),score=148.43 TRINITY_DN96862_c0_g1_i1:30-1598(-)